ncbi:MAG: sensor histidine kinase [Alphaproteobacteria bacterium]|nr:sensor histidine kinase [Alphaproteobacteria bacterium]
MTKEIKLTEPVRSAARPPQGPQSSAQGGLESRSEFYLLYLLFYFTPWFFQAPDRTELIAGLAAAAAFTPVYLFTMGKGRERALAGAAIALALAIGLGPLNGMSGTYAIFAVTMAASVRPPRLAVIAIAVIGLVYWPLSLLVLPVTLFEVAITSFISIMAGAATLAGFNTAERVSLSERALRLDAELAAVRERERIARDLHDVLGHTLTTIAVKSDLANRLMDSDPDAARKEIAEIRDASRASLRDVRAAVAGMNATTLKVEIERARSALESAGVTLSVKGEAPGLEPRADTALGLAMREAATNIIRHSGARSARLTLSAADGSARFTIEDDGGGGAPVEGEGLTGMRRRLEGLGGSLKISEGAAGVRLIAEAPASTRLERI